MKPITQQEPMGCAVACVAFLLRISYLNAKKSFKHPEYARSRGYYCREICDALKSRLRNYEYALYNPKKKALLNDAGTMVFICRSNKYPAGHFLVREKKDWMNPWINFPLMTPAKSGFQKKLPGKPEWIIYKSQEK